MSLLKLAARLPRRLFRAISPSLAYLNLSHNAFEGELPLADLLPQPQGTESDSDSDERGGFPDMPSSPLYYLNISHNRLTGYIPENIGTLTSLTTMDLSCNKLEGPLPSGIGGCSALRNLSLSRCGLTGRLDGTDGGGTGAGGLGKLALLESLRLDYNVFEGSIPPELGNLTCLELLQLQVSLHATTGSTRFYSCLDGKYNICVGCRNLDETSHTGNTTWIEYSPIPLQRSQDYFEISWGVVA